MGLPRWRLNYTLTLSISTLLKPAICQEKAYLKLILLAVSSRSRNWRMPNCQYAVESFH